MSPDGGRDAVLMVRNGGAATGYTTGISLVSHNALARQLALIRRINLFVADDNEGAVRWGDRGQLNIKVSWVSNNQLLVQYSSKARVFKNVPSCQATIIQYAVLP